MLASNLLKYGAVCFIPMAAMDGVYQNGTYQGQTILFYEQSPELPGFLGYFTLVGLPDLTLHATDPGLSIDTEI